MTGSLVLTHKVDGDSAHGLTPLSEFNDSDFAERDAARELQTIYPSDDPKDVVPALLPARVDASVEFLLLPSDLRRLIAPNPKICSCLKHMNKKRFMDIYRTILYELHDYGKGSERFSAKIYFDQFNPPYFDRRITFSLFSVKDGARLLNSTGVDAPSVPTVHVIVKGRERCLAASLLTLWIEREKELKERILWHLAKHGLVFTYNDHELSS